MTIAGLAIGSIYAVVALGFVVVYKTSKVLNFAHAAVGAAGALMFASLITDGGLGIGPLAGLNPLQATAGTMPGWIANLVVAMVLAACLGAIIERIAVRPMIGRSQFSLLVLTIGVSIIVQRFVDRAPIARSLRIPWGAETWTIGGAVISKSALASIVVGLVAVTLIVAFDRSRTGLAARAVASDVEVALTQGIDAGRVYSATWALSAMLATLAAVAFSFSPRGTGVISTASTPELFFRAFPVVAIGGWDSYRGACLAGLGIGLIQIFTGRLLSGHIGLLGAGYPRIIPYVLMLVVLVVRPSGLFGAGAINRV